GTHAIYHRTPSHQFEIVPQELVANGTLVHKRPPGFPLPAKNAQIARPSSTGHCNRQNGAPPNRPGIGVATFAAMGYEAAWSALPLRSNVCARLETRPTWSASGAPCLAAPSLDCRAAQAPITLPAIRCLAGRRQPPPPFRPRRLRPPFRWSRL